MSDSGRIEIVLFDVGGVMLTNGWDHNGRTVVLEQFGLDHDEFEARHEESNDAWERDMISVRDYLEATVFYEPRSFSEEAFLEAMKARSVPLASTAIPVVRELAANPKLLVGVLNNESRVLHEYRMTTFGLNPYLAVQLSSCYIGMRKPNQDMYRRAIDILGRPAERMVFIDDRAVNVEAAVKAGMQAIQYFGEEQLRNNLQELEVL
jgi:putative hydrolase of the HAD superfamily